MECSGDFQTISWSHTGQRPQHPAAHSTNRLLPCPTRATVADWTPGLPRPQRGLRCGPSFSFLQRLASSPLETGADEGPRALPPFLLTDHMHSCFSDVPDLLFSCCPLSWDLRLFRGLNRCSSQRQPCLTAKALPTITVGPPTRGHHADPHADPTRTHTRTHTRTPHRPHVDQHVDPTRTHTRTHTQTPRDRHVDPTRTPRGPTRGPTRGPNTGRKSSPLSGSGCANRKEGDSWSPAATAPPSSPMGTGLRLEVLRRTAVTWARRW